MSRKFNLKNLKTFICRNNSKIPATNHGYHDAKKQNVNLLYQKGYNIGLPMSLNKLICIDVDEKDGKTGIYDLTKLEENLGKLPKTLKQKSCTGNGFHLIFSDEGIVNPKGKIGASGSIDIRWNGYILCEPSSINGKEYKFIDCIYENGNFEITELPVTWINYLNKNSIPKNNNYSQIVDSNYQRKIIEGNFQNMYKNCAFIRRCVDNASTLDELSWFYFACLLNSFSNGEELFDLYSRPHKDYNPVLVKRKFDNAKKYNITCNTILHNCNDCDSCKFKKGDK